MGSQADYQKWVDMEAVEDFKQDEVANIPNSLLISAAYIGKTKKVSLKFYNPESEKIYIWEDKTGHQPYCFSKMAPEDLEFLSERDDVIEIKTVKKIDTLKDKEIPVSKIIVTDPLAIGGTQTTQSIRNVVESWESDIKYYENYLYDNSLIIGKYYKIENDKIIPHDFEMSDETNLAMKSMLFDKLGNTGMTDTKQFEEEVSNWAELLNQPVPKIRRMSLDIEVETDGMRLPDVKIADKKVTAIGFEASDGMKRVFVLRRDGIEEGVNDLDKNIEVVFYEKDQEKKLIEDAFGLVKKYPVLITYNGDGFDLPYLYNRAKRLGISEGTILEKPLLEYYYKNDELGDPIISKEHIYSFEWAKKSEIETIDQRTTERDQYKDAAETSAEKVKLGSKLNHDPPSFPHYMWKRSTWIREAHNEHTNSQSHF